MAVVVLGTYYGSHFAVLTSMKQLSEEKAARVLVDMLIGEDEGKDPLCMARWVLSDFASSLVEAWTPEDKKRVTGQGAEMGMTLVDHAVIGDYDLVLWHAERIGDVYQPYTVSINNSRHSPLSKDDQTAKFKGGVAPITELRAKLNEWLDKYHSLLIGSYVAKKSLVYFKLFKRLFPECTLEPFHKGDLKYGFRITK